MNTNDPSQRIVRRTADFLKSIVTQGYDVMSSSQSVVTKSKENMQNLSKEDQSKLDTISSNYLSLQKVSVDTYTSATASDFKVYQDILADQTFRYLSQVEEIKGVQFK